jgi:glutathione S-transferase
MIRVLVTSYTI